MSTWPVDHDPARSPFPSSAAKPSTTCAAAVPRWWLRVHSWGFAGLIGFNVLLAWLMMRVLYFVLEFMPSHWSEWVGVVLVGMFMGQIYLTAIWLAFGGLPVVLRFAAVALTVSVGTFGAALAAGMAAEQDSGAFFITVGSAMVAVLLAQLVLAPLRWLTGWRIDFDAAYHRRVPGRRMQLGLWHYLLITFVATLPLVVSRAMAALTPEEDSPLAFLSVGLLLAMTVVAAAPLTWLLLARRRSVRAWLAAPLGLAAAAVVDLGVAGGMSSGQSSLLTDFVYLGVQTLAALIPVTINLLLLRLMGLHLFNVKVPPETAAPA